MSDLEMHDKALLAMAAALLKGAVDFARSHPFSVGLDEDDLKAAALGFAIDHLVTLHIGRPRPSQPILGKHASGAVKALGAILCTTLGEAAEPRELVSVIGRHMTSQAADRERGRPQ